LLTSVAAMTTRGITATSAVEFLRICGQLKRLKRTGWVNHHVNGPESVADHMYRMAMCTLLLDGDSSLDKTRCIKMAIVHDLAESFVGDITPHDGVSNEEKHRLELQARALAGWYIYPPSIPPWLLHMVTLDLALEIKELWHEYEDATSDEAKLVKDFDKFEMILQADEYEGAQDNLQLDQFFAGTQGKFKTPLVQSWVAELDAQRHRRRTASTPKAPTTTS
ncbi:hypothetical protein B5M09_006468, partial [Aphanomyces astaci]